MILLRSGGVKDVWQQRRGWCEDWSGKRASDLEKHVCVVVEVERLALLAEVVARAVCARIAGTNDGIRVAVVAVVALVHRKLCGGLCLFLGSLHLREQTNALCTARFQQIFLLHFGKK